MVLLELLVVGLDRAGLATQSGDATRPKPRAHAPLERFHRLVSALGAEPLTSPAPSTRTSTERMMGLEPTTSTLARRFWGSDGCYTVRSSMTQYESQFIWCCVVRPVPQVHGQLYGQVTVV